jgi:hypothetical protein
MKILFVAPVNSIHTVRWIKQLEDANHKLYIFPTAENSPVHEEMIQNIEICIPLYKLNRAFKKVGLLRYYNFIFRNFFFIISKIFPNYYYKRLKRTILYIRPDLVHTLETQGAGYLLSRTKNRYFYNMKFPLWWHTNWGSDIFLFGRLNGHAALISDVLKSANYYSCECERDVKLAFEFGFEGKIFPVYPNTGGFQSKITNQILSQNLLTAQRKVIMLKGYQGWAGRALVGLRALERCAELLQGYTIVIHSNTDAEDIKIASALFSYKNNIPIKLLPVKTSHYEILQWHGKARISIGLSISDGISTSFLEAMAMGSFPIQSNTSAANEWIEDGITGFIVPPEDPDIIETAIRKALTNDVLVDFASINNIKTIQQKADYNILREKTLNNYELISSSLV